MSKMKEGPNDWGLTYNIDWNKSYERTVVKTRDNFAVHLCPECNIAYEIVKDVYQKKQNTYYYKDFPSIGLPRKTCLGCS